MGRLPMGGKKQTASTSTVYLSVSLSIPLFWTSRRRQTSCGAGKRRGLCCANVHCLMPAEGWGVSHAQSCLRVCFDTVVGRQGQQGHLHWPQHTQKTYLFPINMTMKLLFMVCFLHVTLSTWLCCFHFCKVLWSFYPITQLACVVRYF